MYDEFLYGKNQIQNIVGIEYRDGKLQIFTEDYGEINCQELDFSPFVLYEGPVYPECQRLKGNLPLDHFKRYKNQGEAIKEQKIARWKGYETWRSNNIVEGAMIAKGLTFFKGMFPKDVSILSIDLETVEIDPNNPNAKILSAATAFRKAGKIERRLFPYDNYLKEEHLIKDLSDYIRKVDPSLVIGYNLLGFDIPYIANRHDNFRVGRNKSNWIIDERPREKRKDGSQSYSFNACHIYGRQVIDVLHFVIDYDLANERKLPSYKLKEVMAFLKLEKEGRVHFDASQIKELYHIPEEWEKIKAYNLDDAEDPITLLDYIWEPYFYFTQHIPMSFERISQTATGTKINNFMLRSYLQQGHSIPIGDEKRHYEGGISFGNPGLYKNVNKVDVRSMYPSIILMLNLYVKHKDPEKHFLKMMKIFTEQKIQNKIKYEKTKDISYLNKSNSGKIFINSGYGATGAGRLNFNSMDLAEFIAAKGREILNKGIDWAKSKNWEIVNADTDSFSFTTGKKLNKYAFKVVLDELNSLYPEEIEWENDGQYDKFLVVKAKNYVSVKGDEIKIMGNSLKATMKEPALKNFIKDIINNLLEEKGLEDALSIYCDYARDICSIGDRNSMAMWSSKKTVTKAVLENSRTNEARVREAIKGKNYSEGDKIFVFFESPEVVRLIEDFGGIYDKDKLFGKLHSTIKTFANVIDVTSFPNFKLKREKQNLELVLANKEYAIKKMCENTNNNN